jgi:hypothetical protein
VKDILSYSRSFPSIGIVVEKDVLVSEYQTMDTPIEYNLRLWTLLVMV